MPALRPLPRESQASRPRQEGGAEGILGVFVARRQADARHLVAAPHEGAGRGDHLDLTVARLGDGLQPVGIDVLDIAGQVGRHRGAAVQPSFATAQQGTVAALLQRLQRVAFDQIDHMAHPRQTGQAVDPGK